MQDGAECSFDVLISTYELVIVDAEFLSSIHWGYVIVDEAQRLKNSSSVNICSPFCVVLQLHELEAEGGLSAGR